MYPSEDDLRRTLNLDALDSLERQGTARASPENWITSPISRLRGARRFRQSRRRPRLQNRIKRPRPTRFSSLWTSDHKDPHYSSRCGRRRRPCAVRNCQEARRRIGWLGLYCGNWNRQYPEKAVVGVRTVIVLAPEQIRNSLHHYIPADLRNRPCQRNVLRADFHAVLRVTAFLDAAIAHQRG
jgi:hypothetical protein